MVYWFEGPFPLVPTPFAALAKGEKQDVFTESATDMALAHNILIRGLNSIYRQAPYVKPEDEHSFLGYAKNFVNVLKVHHDGEETSFFPACDKMAGEAGVMEKNAQQHAEFHDGLVALQQYIIAALEGKERYDGDRIVMLIDGFGKPLSEHLAEEIQTILDLKRFGPERMKDLLKSLTADGQANLSKIGLMGGVVYAMLGQDSTWENGIWKDFPPAPPGLKAIVMNGLYYWHSSWWKFSPCDQQFMPRPEPYAGPARG